MKEQLDNLIGKLVNIYVRYGEFFEHEVSGKLVLVGDCLDVYEVTYRAAIGGSTFHINSICFGSSDVESIHGSRICLKRD